MNDDEIKHMLAVFKQNLSYLESIDIESMLRAAEKANSVNMRHMLRVAEMSHSINWDHLFQVAQMSNSANWEQMLRAAERVNSVNWDQLLWTMEMVNSVNSEQLLKASKIMNSINMEPILWAINQNSANINPILQVTDVMNSIDWNLIINSIERDSIYINSAFLSSEILHSLEDSDLNESVKIAFPVREPTEGDEFGTKDLNILSIEESKEGLKEIAPKGLNKMENAIEKLEKLLENKCTDESKYQALLKENPWMFGSQYIKISSHSKLDDGHIPDFTGVRVVDDFRDIFEIKQPFLNLFRENGKFSSIFHDSWDQIERYVEFVTKESDYLQRRKGLRFENPKSILLLGYNLEEGQIREIRRKERDSKITVYTYNNLLKLAKRILEFHKGFIEEN